MSIEILTFTGSLATLIIAILAFYQIYTMKKIASSDVIIRYKKDFYTPELREIMVIIEKDGFIFDESKYRFIIIDSVKMGIPFSFLQDSYSPFDIDDKLLRPFEEIGTLYKNKYIKKLDLVYEFFDWHLEMIWDDKAIQKYINLERQKPDNWDLYTNFEFLYNKCKDFERNKKKKQN